MLAVYRFESRCLWQVGLKREEENKKSEEVDAIRVLHLNVIRRIHKE